MPATIPRKSAQGCIAFGRVRCIMIVPVTAKRMARRETLPTVTASRLRRGGEVEGVSWSSCCSSDLGK